MNPGPPTRMIRGPYLTLFSPGLSFEDALQQVNAKNRILADGTKLNDVVGYISITGRRVSKYESITINNAAKYQGHIPRVDGGHCWSGDIVAFTEPGKSFKETSQYSSTLKSYVLEYDEASTGKRWMFPIPQRYEDARDAALLIHHPHYHLEVDGKSRVVHSLAGIEERLDAVVGLGEFPSTDGWYFLSYGVPTGERMNDREQGSDFPPCLTARRLFRARKIVTPLAVGQEAGVYLDGRISTDRALPIAVRSPTTIWTIPERIEFEWVNKHGHSIVRVTDVLAKKDQVGLWSYDDDYHLTLHGPEKYLIKAARLIRKLRRESIPMYPGEFPGVDKLWRKVDFSEFEQE